MKDRVNHLSSECINIIEVEVRIEVITKVDLGPIMYIEVVQDTTKILEAEQDIAQIIEAVMVIILEVIKGMPEIIIIEDNYRNQSYDRNRSFERQSRNRRNSRSMSNGRSRSGSRANTNRDRIRCFKCREYDHFARECPTRQASIKTEQMQQMFNMDEDQTTLQTQLKGTEEEEFTITPMEARDNLNL